MERKIDLGAGVKLLGRREGGRDGEQEREKGRQKEEGRKESKICVVG